MKGTSQMAHSKPSTSLCLLAFLALPLGPPLLADEGPDSSYLSAAELLERLETSDVAYTVHPLKDLPDSGGEALAAEMWPAMGPGTGNPQVLISEDGSRSLNSFPLPEGCTKFIHQGEEYFRKESFAEAATYYQKAVQQFPQCYPAYLNLGDCHYFQGESEKALSWYQKSIELNPHDFISYFYRGNALLKLGRMEAARTSYIHALALHPHRESVLTVAQNKAKELGLEVHRETFHPRALVRQEEEGISIYVDTTSPPWMFYGMCKALWLGEEDFRQRQTGAKEHRWSTTEERQCLLSMLEVYHGRHSNTSIAEDPVLERLFAVFKDELLDAFVLYEIGSRLTPDVMLLLPEDAFATVLDYVDSYVLPEVSRNTTATEGGEVVAHQSAAERHP